MNKNSNNKTTRRSSSLTLIPVFLVPRSAQTGRFIAAKRRQVRILSKALRRKVSSIRNGSLYSFRGQTVRALQVCNNGLRLVGFHNYLFGFAKDQDLKKISKQAVERYLVEL